MNEGLQYMVGLNLGPVEGNSTIAIVERRPDPVEAGQYTFAVLGAERCPQGTPYPAVVEWVKAQLAEYPAEQVVLTVGGTEVDPSVVELLRQAGFGGSLEAVIITDDDAIPEVERSPKARRNCGDTGSGWH